MSDAFCSLLISGLWNELKRCAFLTVKYHNPENLVFLHLLVKGKITNPFKNERLHEIVRLRNGIIIDTLTSIDIIEIVKCGGVFLDVFEGFFCHNLEYNLIQVLLPIYLKKEIF